MVGPETDEKAYSEDELSCAGEGIPRFAALSDTMTLERNKFLIF